MKNIRVMHVYRSLLRKEGGPATSVPSLCRELSAIGCSVTILTREYDADDAENAGGAFIAQETSIKKIANMVKDHDIVHLHGVWPILNLMVLFFCRKNNIPFVVTPRGSLMLDDINKTVIKTIKKNIYWTMCLKKYLKDAAGFHVTALNEYRDLERIGIVSEAANVPNGVNVTEMSKHVKQDILYFRFPELKNKRFLLFLSRIAPKKGVKMLAQAWVHLEEQFPDWNLLIVGPDSNGYWSEIDSILKAKSARRVTYCSYLSGDERIAAFQMADAFVLPTFWENFGIVVAESLMAGTPVLTTTKTPWEELVDQGCGWVIEPRLEDLINKLDEILRLDKSRLKEMGAKGREYVAKNYDWQNLAQDMRRYYEYILGRRPRPEFVYDIEKKNRILLPFSRSQMLS